MTMTTEKLAELKRLAEAATPAQWERTMDMIYVPEHRRIVDCKSIRDAEFIVAAQPAAILSLIALAERALQPEEGQAQKIENPAWFDISTAEWSDDLIWLRRGDEVDGPRVLDHDDYDQYTHWAPCESPKLYASQLALPAGPAPEVINDLRHSAKVDGYTEAQAKFINSIADRLVSPAVAQPVPVAQDKWKCSGCGDGSGWYTSHATGYPHEVPCSKCNPSGSPKGHVAQVAVAQPVADERAALALYEVRAHTFMQPNVWKEVVKAEYDRTPAAHRRIVYARAALCQPAEEGGKA